MKNRTQRQLAIRKIIVSKEIDSQERLLAELRIHGFDLTQATLSRDLKSLKVAKMPHGANGYLYTLPDNLDRKKVESIGENNFLADGFLELNFSGNMAVMRTKPGYASSIAAVLDSANPYEVIGSVAGDDTILLIMREEITRNDLINSLLLIMPKLENKIGKSRHEEQ